MKYLSIMGVIFLFFMTSCENGITGEGEPDIAQDFLVDTFDEVEAEGLFKLVLIESDSTYISVQTHKNLIDNLNIYVQNGALNIDEEEAVEAFESYEVYVYYQQPIKKITIKDKVLCQSAGVITYENLELEAHNDAIFDMFEVNTNKLKLFAADNSSIEISGVTKEVKVKAKKKGVIDASELRSRVLEADLADEAEVQSQIEDEVKGRVLGKSILNYEGNPTKNIEVKDHAQVIKN